MTRLRCRFALLREERAYTLPELLAVMVILSVVLTALVALMATATHAEVRLNREFQAQSQARGALTRFRRETHAACRATPVGATASVTLTFLSSGTCPATGGTQVSWCTVANGSSGYGLFRATGATCNGTGTRVADHLTVANAFDYRTTSRERGKIGITLAVNPDPRQLKTYTLTDEIVLRNSARAA